jgi:hypothetical protein
MHFNLEQVLWALVLAGHLILLIVLLGRDRIARFPWFSAMIMVSAIRLIADHLLHDKLATASFYWQNYVGILVSAVITILALIEVGRQVYASGKAGRILKARGWVGWSMVMLAIGLAIVWAWGRPWPTWAAMRAEPAEFPILLTAFTAVKLMLLVNLITVMAGLLMGIFGKRFGAGWKSHAQQVMLGLSTNAAAIVAVEAIQDIIRRNVHFTADMSREARNQIVVRLTHLFSHLDNASKTLWLVVLLWWIYWLWRDEPGGTNPDPASVEVPVLAGPPSDGLSAEAEIPPDELA